MMFAPVAVSACPTFVIATSAIGLPTSVVVVATLSAESESAEVVVTVDILAMGFGVVYPEGTANAVVILRVWPAGIVPRTQGNPVVQSPALPTKVNPVGVGSVTVTSVTSRVPLLVTVIP